MRYVLVTDSSCLASMTATRWASGKNVEVVNINDCSEIAQMYGVGRLPTLLSIGDYGVITGKIDGFNERKYNETYGGNAI